MKYLEFKDKVKGLPFFSASQLSALTDEPETLKVQLCGWKKKGLIQSLRRGLYVLGASERVLEPHIFYLANQLFVPSYVSLESALAYYGLIPEFVAAVTSVTVRKTCRFENEFGLFTYQHVIPEGFGGFESIRESDKFPVLIALPEKAVVDFLYLTSGRISGDDPNVFTESYRFQHCENLNSVKLRELARRFGSSKLMTRVELFIREVLHARSSSKRAG